MLSGRRTGTEQCLYLKQKLFKRYILQQYDWTVNYNSNY